MGRREGFIPLESAYLLRTWHVLRRGEGLAQALLGMQLHLSLLQTLNSLINNLLLEYIVRHLYFDRVFLAYDFVYFSAIHISW